MKNRLKKLGMGKVQKVNTLFSMKFRKVGVEFEQMVIVQ